MIMVLKIWWMYEIVCSVSVFKLKAELQKMITMVVRRRRNSNNWSAFERNNNHLITYLIHFHFTGNNNPTTCRDCVALLSDHNELYLTIVIPYRMPKCVSGNTISTTTHARPY